MSRRPTAARPPLPLDVRPCALLLSLALLLGPVACSDDESGPTDPGGSTPDLGLEFVRIDAGSFVMGSPETEPGRFMDETQHTVTLTTPFEMATTEVTNEQYAAMLQWAYDNGHVTATPTTVRGSLDGADRRLVDLDSPACQIRFADGRFSSLPGFEDHPMREVTWYGAIAFCDWLSLQEGLPRAYDHDARTTTTDSPYEVEGYRLPTEAEWEYAARAGATTALPNGPITETECGLDPNLDPIAWYCANVNDPRSGDVGVKQANAWGLHDMLGNVYEWCTDPPRSYGADVTDPYGDAPTTFRADRGGSAGAGARYCRPAYRNAVEIDEAGLIGFRLVRSLPQG